VKIEDIVRRIQAALPQQVVETALLDDMIVIIVDGRSVLRMYPDAEYNDEIIDIAIEEIKRTLATPP
jgi:hypothetical protein